MAINFIGFHGTTVKNADQIIKDTFHPKRRENHWLGQGTYFFDDRDLAIWFPSASLKNKGKDIAIIKVELEVEKEQLLDLDKIRDINKFYSEILMLLEKTKGKIVFKEDSHYNLCFLLDLYKKVFGIKIVKFTFRVKNPFYGHKIIEKFNNQFFVDLAYNQLQICIVDDSVIKKKSVEKEYNLKDDIDEISFLIRKR